MKQNSPFIWVINPKKVIFYSIFYITFCFSGILSILSIMSGVIDYRMGLFSFLVIPLFFIYGVKIDEVIFAFLILTLEIFVSGFVTQTSIINILIFLRIIIFSVLIYQVVNFYITQNSVVRVIKVMVIISLIQLPIILLQRFFYKYLPTSVSDLVDYIDFDFGSFNFMCDPSMSYFILLIIIFLLFATKQNYFIKNKWAILPYLSLTVLITNSNISIVILAVIWVLYLLMHFNIKTIVITILIISIIFGILSVFGSLERIVINVVQSINSNTNINSTSLSTYFSGGYGRGAAIDYYLHSDILWLGDGPSKYYDAINRVLYIGNTGHLLTFYSEIGLIGWILSIWVLFLISFPRINGRRKFSWVSLLSFFAIQMLSITTQIMNDISVMLAFCIISKFYLIPQKNDISKSRINTTIENRTAYL